jgi:hypothetical protein
MYGRITRVCMFAMLDGARPDTECIRDLALVVVRRVTVRVIGLVLRPELPLTGNSLLCENGLTEV